MQFTIYLLPRGLEGEALDAALDKPAAPVRMYKRPSAVTRYIRDHIGSHWRTPHILVDADPLLGGGAYRHTAEEWLDDDLEALYRQQLERESEARWRQAQRADVQSLSLTADEALALGHRRKLVEDGILSVASARALLDADRKAGVPPAGESLSEWSE